MNKKKTNNFKTFIFEQIKNIVIVLGYFVQFYYNK